MAGPSVLDMLKTNVQKGFQSAGNSLFSGAPNAVGSAIAPQAKPGGAMSASDELAKLQKDGPPDSLHYGRWQDRMAELQQQIRSGKK